MYANVPARLTTITALQPRLTAMWDGPCGKSSLHVARLDVGARVSPRSDNMPRLERGWKGSCERCGVEIPWDEGTLVSGQLFRIWDTPSEALEPGCLFWQDDYKGHCSGRWSNCDGRHLNAVLPNGHHWDIDSRASNCTLKEDTIHRCWVRVGEPPNVHISKDGLSCAAGAGSILAGDYHGFLHHGVFTSC